MVDSVGTVYRRLALLSTAVVGLIALVGSGLGYLFAGEAGISSALIGAVVALLFSILTVGSFWIGSKLSLAGFMGVVLGGWIVKFVVFAAALLGLRDADFVNGPVFFFSLVTAVLGGLAVDAWVVSKARLTMDGIS
jgi:hypothetical protein